MVKKRQKDISGIDHKIISMYAKCMTTQQISETIEDIYGFETSDGFISDVTGKLLPQIEDWQNRPLDETYPILYIDAIHYYVRDNGMIRKLEAYVILGINTEGQKEVLRKAFSADLKTVYQAADEKEALAELDRVTEKWTPKYPNSMKRWKDNWDAISPIFKFSATVRKVIYTTNAIKSLNSTYRKFNRQRSIFPSDTALLKALYLVTFETTTSIFPLSIFSW